MEVRCPYCGYVWDTKSMHIYVTCPSCLKKVRARQSPAYVEPETRIVRDRGGVVTRTVFEIGKSHAITLPKEFVEAHGIKGGDAVIIYFDDDVAHIEPVKKEDIVKKVNK